MRRAFTLLELLIVMAIVGIVMAIAIPNLIEARKHANEAAAVGALKSIVSAQTLFREGDRDGDQLHDYGTLAELTEATVVDQVLGTGTKQGYTFATASGSEATDYIFFATGNPQLIGRTGDRSFATNHEGVIYYTSRVAIDPGAVTNARIPAGMQVLE